MSYTDDQIDQKLKSKADTDCVYNVCEMNQILANKAGIDSIELIKKNIQSNNDDLNKNIAQEAIERKEADGNLQNEISAIDVRVEFIENQNGVGQKVITSVSKYSDLSSLDTYDGKTVYVENIGLYKYVDSTKKWAIDKLFDLAPELFSSNYVSSNNGYSKGSRIVLNDGFTTVISLIDGNTSDPNQDMSNWAKINDIDTKDTVTYKTDKNELSKAISWQNRNVYVQGDGNYYYKENAWVKDETLNVYDFKTQQYLQYYYNQLGNWDDAIFQAQLNIYLKGFSPKLLFPTGSISISKPIVGGIALALKVHEYLVANGIETDFYNSTTNTFKKNVWGQQFIATRSCTINWTGSTIGTDKTWRDWAVFHIGCPPTRMDWIQNEGKSPAVDDHVKFENIIIFGGGAFVHGIFLQRQSFLNTNYVQVLSCLGAGFMIDRCYDSVFNKLTVLHCGRMTGDTERDAYEKGYGLEKQLYAPVHIMKSSGDNSNYVVFKDLHVENNDNCIADIIVTGDSSPIIFDKVHFECGYSDKYSRGLKRLFRIGQNSGVSFFAQENTSSFNPDNPALNGGGGYVLANNINGTLSGYQYGVHLSSYGQIYINDSSLPNGLGNVLIETDNSSAIFDAVHASIGNIEITGGNSQVYALKLTNSNCKNITGSYFDAMILNDVICDNISLANLNTKNNRANPIVFNNVSANQLSVTNSNLIAIGNIALRSSDNPSATLEAGSDLNIFYSGNAVANYLEY